MHIDFRRFRIGAAALLAGCAAIQSGSSPERDDLGKLEHIVVIYAENRSFDHLYGMFPGAHGIADASPESYVQLDRDGKPMAHLPPVWKGDKPDPAFPATLPNRPFRIDAPPIDLPLAVETRDLVHRFYQNQEQINGGRNDRFAAVSDAGGLVMGYYDGSRLPMWKWAKEFVLADNFFMGAKKKRAALSRPLRRLSLNSGMSLYAYVQQLGSSEARTAHGRAAMIFRYSSSVNARSVSDLTPPFEPVARATLAIASSLGASETITRSYCPVTM